MTTVIPSIGLKGMEGYVVEVEVQLVPGIEGMSIVGLPDASVKESRERVLATLYAYGCEVLDKKIIVNLSPSEQRKNSPIFDLAMAIGIMKESGFIKQDIPKDATFLGVLSLGGEVKPVEGMLPAILSAKRQGFKVLYVPPILDVPIHKIEGIECRFVYSIDDVIPSFSGQMSTFQFSQVTSLSSPPTASFKKDFKQVIGHEQAKRALEISAAGGHNVLMSGPPGCGKSLLSECYPSLLPNLSPEDYFEVLSIYQLAGVSPSAPHLPPYRSPHHSASSVSLIGGGSHPKPGEVSLAHRGVLFLDEMAEFPKRTLDMLRQPIETGRVTISRATATVMYPARFILLGAMNPCPCGYLGSNEVYCTCTPNQIQSYRNRISGPIIDRMDILLSLSPVQLDIQAMTRNESSAQIAERVLEARERQHKRYQGESWNGTVSVGDLLKKCPLSPHQEHMLNQASRKQQWSTRTQVKIIRLARTISDLLGSPEVTDEALWEALTLRRWSYSKDIKVSRGS
ncbi:YifB family Mg chelatase-like AAA ATPase [Pullulanibacillus sp. KACC 23026]|uniref:YifB family Mg chelatase-like AAA ATPase n=1 Tax=Pullulanibacillus sp. KACC 23026 TaxID=3028315 RepID=UPI0023AE8942|nr:YifB family Mg chelatase-like AAA ATPase [Pullulanibacillus sp. KACC 23026]WEG13399.1 YifB family Mg chelatase-like AAA ATPase [Pullulanibacillus sp. KACC 23026]